MYKKRTGTSGIQGQLYETKLLSLIYFRLTHDDSVEKFSLATNRDDIGEFDDISMKVNVKGFDKPLALFLQAKHRENDKLLTFNSESDLVKYFSSYLKIRHAFDPSNKDMIFEGKFDEIECFFIMYTTAKDDGNNKIYEGNFADYFDKLIGTGGCCTQPSNKDEDLDILCKIVIKDQIRILAEQLVKFISDESDSEMSMNSDIMLRYHIVLALNVFNVSEIQPEGHRIANFRQDFFTTNEEFIVLIKNLLCLGILKKRKPEENDVQSLLLKFLSELSEVTTLSKLIGSVLTYRNDKLEFVSESITDDLKRQLDKANVPQSTVYEAAELAAKEYLLSLKLKVPASFGNKDLTIRGNNKKIEKRLNYLTTKVLELLQQSKSNHIVTIDESLGDGFLQLNGGIASAVGNILVFDETSKLLRFTDNCNSLGNLAKTWYETLTTKIKNLHEYKLDVKVKKFPKLSFDQGEYDVSLVRDFYSKLLFYTNQANQNGVEKILREEIEDQPCNDVNNFRVRSDVIFLKYHDEIQRLWMMPKEGSYLTEKSKVFENVVANAMSEPLMSVIQMMHNIKNKVFTFNEDVINRFVSHGQVIGDIIVSDICVLTVAKVIQYLGSKDNIVLDLEYILKLPLKSHNTLCKELTNTNKAKIFVVVCYLFGDLSDSYNRLENIAKSIDGKPIIVITNNISMDIMIEIFLQNDNVWNDERIGYADLSVESQKNFLATYKVKFQGKDVSLDMILDDESVKFIDLCVFYKLIVDETFEIGSANIYRGYEKQFYIDRRVSRTTRLEHDKFNNVKDKVLTTFYDLEDDVVLLTAEPGMGKSTLLSHLQLKTKEIDPKVWIIRININDFQLNFGTRFDSNTENTLELMCQAALGDKSIQLQWDLGMRSLITWRKNPPDEEEPPVKYYVSKKENVYFKDSPFEYYFSNLNRYSSHLKVFQIKLFLRYYNRGKLILLIEDFDERIPECTDSVKIIVDECLKRKHKIWITSSSPSSTSDLELLFGPSYNIEYFSHLEQEMFLNTIWKFRIQFTKFYTMPKIEEILNCYQIKDKQYLRVYELLLEFLKVQSKASGIEFPYDEYYNRFKTRFGLSEDTIPCIPQDTSPGRLYYLARDVAKKACLVKPNWP